MFWRAGTWAHVPSGVLGIVCSAPVSQECFFWWTNQVTRPCPCRWGLLTFSIILGCPLPLCIGGGLYYRRRTASGVLLALEINSFFMPPNVLGVTRAIEGECRKAFLLYSLCATGLA